MGRKTIAFGLLLVASALGIGVLAFAAVDVSNDSEPSRAEQWIASGLLDIKIRAGGRSDREFFTSDVDLETASNHYQQMYSFCHGATRGKMAPLAKRFSPRPPQFVIQPSRNPTWKDVYVIQHGIRWTGMPSFPGLSEEQAWGLALYVEGLSQPRSKYR